MTSNFKILGQEPAAVLAALRAVLTVLVTFGLSSYLTTETSGIILATFSGAIGLVEAYVTRSTVYTAFVAFAQTLLILVVSLGWNLDDVKQGAILSAVAVVAGLFLRNTTVSNDTAISAASSGAMKQDLELLALTNPAPVAVVDRLLDEQT